MKDFATQSLLTYIWEQIQFIPNIMYLIFLYTCITVLIAMVNIKDIIVEDKTLLDIHSPNAYIINLEASWVGLFLL
jgi:hypothetical protein